MATNITADGNSDDTFNNPEHLHGRRVVVGLSGTFGSGTVTVKYLVGSDVCKFDQTDEPAFTSGGGTTVTIPAGATALRYVTSGSTSPDINTTYKVLKADV